MIHRSLVIYKPTSQAVSFSAIHMMKRGFTLAAILAAPTILKRESALGHTVKDIVLYKRVEERKIG